MAKSGQNRRITPAVSLRKRYKPGDLTRLQQKLWRAVEAAEAMLYADEITFSDQVRALHALIQAAGAYRNLLETAELEKRIADLEAALEAEQSRRTI